MSRHRDFQKINYEDYADDDYGDEDYDYDDGYDGTYDDYAAPTSSAQRNNTAKATAASAAFFKTKPAKKKGGTAAATATTAATKGVAASSSGAAASSATTRHPSPGTEQMDADTAAAIAASLADAQAQEAFMREAGLAPSPSPSPPASASSTPVKAAAPLRSEQDKQATLAALEQLRLEKQRQKSGEAAAAGRPVAQEVPRRTPSASPGLYASDSYSSLAPPSDSPSLSRSTTPSSSPAPLTVLQSSPLPQTSAKRTKEVNAVLSAEAEREGANKKERLNMVVIGHVDSGKSTLMGHLLFLQGRVSKKLMHSYEKQSKEMGKGSFHFAWVLDETDAERERGVTVDVAVNYFETPSKKITLLDAPGHRDFIPNMITGAAQADAAIMVVPAAAGEFEAGFSMEGQIREHALLARSLGVAQLILAVNKLDTCDWSQERYNEIVSQMVPYLRSVGFKDKDIWSIPVSGLTGENIMARKEAALEQWYNGPVLLDLIDQFALPQRYTDKPMRMCVQDVFKSLTLGQAVAGKLESGTILPRDKLLLLPLGETVTVKTIESRGEPLNIAQAGDNVELGIKDISDPAVLQIGQWLCDPLHPIPQVVHFRAQIITLNYKVPLLAGTQLLFFTAATQEPVSIHSLHSLIDKGTGAVIKRRPRVIPRQSTAVVELVAKNKICLELFRNYKELGRFTLRRGDETVAVGIVTRLYRMK